MSKMRKEYDPNKANSDGSPKDTEGKLKYKWFHVLGASRRARVLVQ